MVPAQTDRQAVIIQNIHVVIVITVAMWPLALGAAAQPLTQRSNTTSGANNSLMQEEWQQTRIIGQPLIGYRQQTRWEWF